VVVYNAASQPHLIPASHTHTHTHTQTCTHSSSSEHE